MAESEPLKDIQFAHSWKVMHSGCLPTKLPAYMCESELLYQLGHRFVYVHEDPAWNSSCGWPAGGHERLATRTTASDAAAVTVAETGVIRG